MARTWLISSRGIAKKIKNAARLKNYQVRDIGTDAKRECPNCRYLIDNSDVSLEWPGLPAGVKFDPSDIELLEHLAGKVGMNNSVPHMFIDEFIPTLDMEQGICYTHPENLPGVKKDGSSVHFFYRTSNAYATGHRKRRKIQSECSISEERVRWHKTGKTKPVLENGVQIGWKKIMVLYRSSKRCCKPDKANWVMHQYHLGSVEEEEDGELVVSKIFYQQQLKQVDKSDNGPTNEKSDQWTVKTGLTEESDERTVKTGPAEESDQWTVKTGPAEESDQWTVKTGPTTPKIITPQPPRTKKIPEHESDKLNHEILPTLKEHDVEDELPMPPLFVQGKDESINPSWWAGESQGIEEPNLNDIDESLLCHEVLDSFPPIEESFYLDNHNIYYGRDETNEGIAKTGSGFSDLDNIVIDTPPDFQLSDLQFGSQDSITSWLDRL